jgi:hypothetical protein
LAGYHPTNTTCSVPESIAIIDGIATGNVFADEAGVLNVSEVRCCSPNRVGDVSFTHNLTLLSSNSSCVE